MIPIKKNEIRWEDVKVKTREDSQIDWTCLRILNKTRLLLLSGTSC